MAEAADYHFQGLLGTLVDREFSLDLHFLYSRSKDLSDLYALLLFSEAEVWEAVRRLPHGKAPGPDGLTMEFL